MTFLTKIIGKAVYLKTDSHAPAVDRMADQFEIRSWYRFCSSLDDKKKKKSKRFVLGLFTGTLPNVIPPMHHLGFPLGA